MQLFQISVPLWQYILSQAFGFTYLAIMFMALQYKKKSTTLRLYAVGNVFSIISNGLLLNFVLVGTKGVSLFKNISFSYIQDNREKIHRVDSIFVLVLFVTLAYAVGIFTWGGFWFNWVIISALAFSYFGEWHKNVHLLRIGTLVYVAAVFVNALMFANFADMLMCIVTVIAVVVFYVDFFRNRKKRNPDTQHHEPSAQEATI